MDTALTQNHQNVVLQIIPALKEVGFDIESEFKTSDPYGGGDYDTSLAAIALNGLFESALGDKLYENSASLFEASSVFFDQIPGSVHQAHAKRMQAQHGAELAMAEMNLRAMGVEVGDREREIMHTHLLFKNDMALQLASTGGLNFTADGTQLDLNQEPEIANVRLPRYLEALRKQIGEERMAKLLNTPIFAMYDENPQKGEPNVSMISPMSFAFMEQTPQDIRDIFLNYGGSVTEMTRMLGYGVEVQGSMVPYPILEMNQFNVVMDLAYKADVETLETLEIGSTEANSQSPSGFKPAALHSAFLGAAVRYAQLSKDEQRALMRGEKDMDDFIQPVVDSVRFLLEQGADPDTVSEYFSPEGQIWYNVTEWEIGRGGTPLHVADAVAKAVAKDFDEARVKLGRKARNGILKLAQPNSGVCRHILVNMRRAGWQLKFPE